jgi:hypothetical protein
MIRKSFVAAAVATLACLTFVMPSAEAGGGMGQGAGLTTCRLVVAGPPQPQTVSVSDGFVSSDEVRVGALALVCDLPALGATVSGAPTGAPLDASNAVACYVVRAAEGARIPTSITDPFTAVNTAEGIQPITLSSVQFICLPACLGPAGSCTVEAPTP